MPYRIRPERDLGAEFRATARHQLKQAIEVLETCPEGLHEAIHAARKRIKRLRNLYRLVAAADRGWLKRENARLRDTAASLSRARDAQALVETTDYLAGFTVNAEETETLTRARLALLDRRDALASSDADMNDKVHAAIEQCRNAISAIDDLKLPTGATRTARRIAKAWRQALERAEAARNACAGEGHGEAFHDLRKAGQAYWMHLTLLRALWPSAFKAKAGQARRLVKILGHEQDLTVLTNLLDHEPERFGDGETLSFMLAMIIRRQQALRDDARTLAAAVFADAPQAEAERIAILWRAAAKGPKKGTG
jgi:CHAD domain-containing protein